MSRAACGRPRRDAAAPIVAKLVGLDLDQIAFCCITGANETPAPLHPDDLPPFAGKVVVIAVHDDSKKNDIGARAAAKWARQLYEAGAAQVRGFDFAGTGGKDLADYLCGLAKPITAPPAVITPPAPERPAESKGAAPVRAPLIPLESPWIDGARYRFAGAFEIPSRLPLFYLDPDGDTRRLHGVLVG
jgi:hypothetical protein